MTSLPPFGERGPLPGAVQMLEDGVSVVADQVGVEAGQVHPKGREGRRDVEHHPL